MNIGYHKFGFELFGFGKIYENFNAAMKIRNFLYHNKHKRKFQIIHRLLVTSKFRLSSECRNKW